MHGNNIVTTASHVMFSLLPILWLKPIIYSSHSCQTLLEVLNTPLATVIAIAQTRLYTVIIHDSLKHHYQSNSTSATLWPKIWLHRVTFHVSRKMTVFTFHVEVPRQQKYNSTESYSTSAENMTTQSHVPLRMPREQKIWLARVTCHVGFWPQLPGQTSKSQGLGAGQDGGWNADVACTWRPSIRFKAYLFIWLGVRSDSSVTTAPSHAPRHIPHQQKIWRAVTDPSLWLRAVINAVILPVIKVPIHASVFSSCDC